MPAPAAHAPTLQTAPSGEAASWQLFLLGRVQAHSATASITQWPTRAVASLLARLAMGPHQSHPREELVALLWPEAPPDKGRARLRQALSNLRSLLRTGTDSALEPLLADRSTVRLNPAALSCDVLQFRRLVQLGRPDEARALYVGELMPGHYDEWVLEERQQLQRLLERLSPATPAAGAPAATCALAATAPARPPSSAPPAWEAVRMPAYWTRAFGQAAAVHQLSERVAAHRLVTVLGPGGHGKTRLAVATASSWPDGRLPAFERRVFVPLADAADAEAVWTSLVGALGLEGAGDPSRRVPLHLGSAASLLVMDNAEQLSASAVQVMAQLLADCPGLHLLVTSRRRLGLDGEALFDTPALALPEPVAPTAQALDAAVANYPAVALFVDRARQSRPEFHLTPANAAAVVELVRLLGGMPLAIELAASRLRALQPRELLQRLAQDAGSPTLDLLARPGKGAAAGSRHASLRQVVAWSWRQLSAPVAELLQALSVFTAPASLAAAAQAWAALGSAPANASQLQAWLAEAVDASLLNAVRLNPAGPGLAHGPGDDADADTGYALAPPVREFAAEQCAAQDAAHRRSHLRLWLAELARQGLPQQRLALQAELVHAWPLLLAARADGAAHEAVALTVALQSELNWGPVLPMTAAVLEWALADLAPSGQEDLVSAGHYLLAAHRQMHADGPSAVAHAQMALTTAPSPRRKALALSLQIWIRLERGESLPTDAAELAQALPWIRSAQDSRSMALVLSVLAQLAQEGDEDLARAQALLGDCIRMFEACGDQVQADIRHVRLASCWASSGEANRALDLLEALVAQANASTQSVLRIHALTALGRVRLQRGQHPQAHDALQQAAELAQAHAWLSLVLPALLPLPRVWAASGAFGAAARLQGHLLHHWPTTMGGFKPADARANRALQQRLRRRLGAAALQAHLRAGAALTRPEILANLPDQRLPVAGQQPVQNAYGAGG